MQTMATLSSIRSLTLDLPPSCIQFCPGKPHLFVVGTYFLHAPPSSEVGASTSPNEKIEARKAAQKRTGSLVLYELSPENIITEIQSLPTDFAILDIQWTPHSELVGGDLLAVATSTGILTFYRLQQQQEQQPPKLVLSHVQHITDDDTTLVLSLTWHPVRPGVLGLTLSDGRVCVCTSTSMGTGSGSGSSSTEEDDTAAGLWSQGAAVSLQDVHEHELEAWMMTFTPESLNVLSGGDDMVLQCSHVADDDGDDDDESEEEAEQEEGVEVEDEQHVQKTNKNKTNLLWQNRKLHHAGITAILPLSETLVITGSYDDHIRLLQLPKTPGDTRPKLLAELNLGGGVWRLKLLTTGRASSSSSQRDDDSADAAENKSSSDSTVSALRRSCSSGRNSITSFILLCSCMHAGTRIVQVIHEEKKIKDDEDDEWTFHVLAKFEEHESMNYGSDVQPDLKKEKDKEKEEEKEKKKIVSTSFYDRRLCLWTVEI